MKILDSDHCVAVLQSASIALANDLVFVTHNSRHFSRLAETAGLKLDDWL